MNIFVVNEDPVASAVDLADQHIVKMPLESAQMLCSTSNEFGVVAPWRSAFLHHPCTKWVMHSLGNWEWLVEHGISLCEEYTRRYKKRHGAQDVIEWCAVYGGAPKMGARTDFAQAMPDKYKSHNAVIAYRSYYIGEKLKFARWRHSVRPEWTI